MNVLWLALLSLLVQNAQPELVAFEGIVVKAGTNESLAGARVELRRLDVRGGANYFTIAGDDGRFSLRNVRHGRYFLMATRSGYISIDGGRTIAIDRDNADIRVPVTPAGVIYGHVYDQQQRPVVNAEIEVMRVSSKAGRSVLELAQTVSTNDLGEYRAFWLSPGRYYVSALHPDGGRLHPSNLAFGGYMLSIRQAVTIQLPQDRATAQYVPVFSPSTTDEQNADAIDLGPGAEIGGIDITVFPVQRQIARGVIVDASTGLPARNARLFVSRNPARINDAPYIGVDSTTGAFEVSDLLPGSYTVLATAGTLSGRLTLDIGDQDVGNTTIRLTSGFTLRGRIRTDSETVPTGIRVELHPEPDIPDLKMPGPPNNGTASRDGSFSLTAVPPGEYRLDVTMPAGLKGAFVKSASFEGVDVLNEVLRVPETTTGPLELVIGTRPGTLDGHVVDAGQRPVAGVTALLLPGYRAASTDASGRFHFDALPPGNYILFASDEPDSIPSEDRGTPVQIIEAAEANVDTVLISRDQ
jgi:hypothetical protein